MNDAKIREAVQSILAATASERVKPWLCKLCGNERFGGQCFPMVRLPAVASGKTEKLLPAHCERCHKQLFYRLMDLLRKKGINPTRAD